MSKTKRIIYQAATPWLSRAMFATGVVHLVRKNAQAGLDKPKIIFDLSI